MTDISPTLRPSGLLFDLDNTLYDREAAFDRWMLWFLDDVLKLRDADKRAALTAEAAAMDAHGYGSKRAIFQCLYQRYPAPPGAPNASVEMYYDHFFTQMRVEPETRALLAALRAAHIPYGIVTNGSRVQARKIDEMGFREGTKCILVSGIVGCDKPDPAIFAMAARKLDLPPSEILFVGDHPSNDVWGAREAGMRTAWLHRGQRWSEESYGPPPEFTLDRVDDLISVLRLVSTTSPAS